MPLGRREVAAPIKTKVCMRHGNNNPVKKNRHLSSWAKRSKGQGSMQERPDGFISFILLSLTFTAKKLFGSFTLSLSVIQTILGIQRKGG